MTASDQEILNAAKDSLKRILETDTAEWEQEDRRQVQLEINRLEALITRYERKIAMSAGRRIHQPIRRVNL